MTRQAWWAWPGEPQACCSACSGDSWAATASTSPVAPGAVIGPRPYPAGATPVAGFGCLACGGAPGSRRRRHPDGPRRGGWRVFQGVGWIPAASPPPLAPDDGAAHQPRSSRNHRDMGGGRESAPGTSGWEISGQQRPDSIEGYASVTSAQRGESVGLYVSTAAPTFHVEAYRIGWYQGHGGRLVWSSPDAPGGAQPNPAPQPGTNMVECHWKASMTLTVGADWPPGDYILKLVGSGGQQSWVPLTVRDDTSRATYLVLNAVTTWQAYNLWGGYSLYQGLSGRGHSDFAHRSRVVSFDRPYSFGSGAADFYGNEYPLVRLVERLGLDVSYATDVDLDEEPGMLQAHRAVISLGHDEYWSTAMRDGATEARDQGVNLMFLGANAVYRHIRFASSPLGQDRHEICYKVASEDPLHGVNDSEVTSNWPDPPVPRPESDLVGDMYRCNPVKADLVVVDPSSFVVAGTGLTAGAKLAGVVGSEYDRYVPSLPGPRNVEIVAHSPLTCRGAPDHSDVTYYTAPSGAGVFASGTN